MELNTVLKNDKSIRVAIPHIQFPSEHSIKIGSQIALIDPDSRQAHVLKYFYSDPKNYLPKSKLIDIVHEETTAADAITFRHEFALWQSSNQVLCRLRRTLSEKFKYLMPTGTEWLPFSEDLQGWILYKLPAYGSDGGWH